MSVRRLRDNLLIGAALIGIVVAVVSMLAVSIVIRQQHLDQSNALLTKASRVVSDELNDRQGRLLSASRQLATQKNLGSTLWYLTQYTRLGIDRETLGTTYRQLAADVYKIGRVANLSQLALYDLNGNLVAFSQSKSGKELIGYVNRTASPTFMLATPKSGDEPGTLSLRESAEVDGFGLQYGGPLPQQERATVSVIRDKLAIESQVPVMGVAFDPATGRQEIKQLGLVAAVQFLDEAFIDYLARLTDVKINVFGPRNLSSGSLAAYQTPDWGTRSDVTKAPAPTITCNETVIEGMGYYQCITPIYADKQYVGSIAVLRSSEIVQKNLWQMIRTLALIAAACLVIVSPLCWYYANTISNPLVALSRIFREVAAGERKAAFDVELYQLEQTSQQHAELRELTKSFVTMDLAINQKIQEVREINASLEKVVAERTAELRVANDELTKLVSHDSLTGLPNRKLLADRIQLALAGARRNAKQLALLYIDFDEFKPINDTLGHDFGDLLLVEAARRLQASVRESDTVARVGGDEFIVLLPTIESETDALTVANKIRSTISLPFVLADQDRHISTSIGIAIFPDHGSDEATLLKNADSAMYVAKKNGRNRVELFAPLELSASLN